MFFSYRLMKYLITNKNTTKLQINVKHWTNFFLLIFLKSSLFFFFFFTKKIPKYFFSKVQSFRIFCSSVQNNNMVFHSVCIIFRSSSFWAIIERRQEETSRKGQKFLAFFYGLSKDQSPMATTPTIWHGWAFAIRVCGEGNIIRGGGIPRGS